VHPNQVLFGALVAVGEIGLDFSPWILESTAKVWGVSVDDVKAEQRRVFSVQIELAKERGLPVNVHSRNAGHHAIAVLEECGMLDRALLHAFDGAPKHAVRAAQLGALFSVPGSIARDDSTKRLVDKLPLTSLCLESDAPALPPVKGDRTWPLHSLVVSAQHIASIKGVSVEDVAHATTENASKLFRLQLKESIS
ncbi:putative deoxyribonuclease tatdn3-B, partial [Rhizoclosmatium globosum]